MEERNNNYTIMEGCTLPSKGLIYDQKVNPNIELRSMTARDEMKRLNPSATPLKTLADIIENCCIEKPAIHVYDMAVGDYEFLLHKLRIVTYGPEYKVSVTCPYCGEGVDTSAKLDELEVKEFDAEEFEAIRTFTLPVGGQIVSLKFNTPRALDSIENKAKEMKRKAKGAEINFDTYAQMLYVIDTVDGKVIYDVKPGTQTDTKIRLRGKGVPSWRNKDVRGDHYITLVVQVPDKLKPEAKELLRQFDALTGDSLNAVSRESSEKDTAQDNKENTKDNKKKKFCK